ncbi:MAG: acyl-CoA dehydrogenase family protein [Ignavibacteria bacterium]|nr:acyl-CoA dehydrogenase family protein [Ignavibacteria bacterium]
MPNYFTENRDLVNQFNKLELRKVVEILEHGYTQAREYDFAPKSYEEALEIYKGSLELVGDISGNFIAPRAEAVDAEGARLENGTVHYAKGTRENLDKLSEAGLMGVIIPRCYGGANFPATIYMMMIEMVSRADASLMTLFGYQDVGETIARLGTKEQGEEFLLNYTSGEWTGATCLTEPGAGSDLQSVKLEAYQDDTGQWRLRGLKHFISNGNGEVLVVLARSEPGTKNMFGLSLFACHGTDERVRVNRIEHKMGLHGSPTCEIIFDDAPAQLLGRRRFGLFNVLYILNHARFSVAAQAIGIAEAAYGEALQWSKDRVQFGRALYTMPPIANTLIEMRVAIEASRSLLYGSVQWLDRRNKIEEEIAELKAAGKPHEEQKAEFDRAARYTDLLSPLVKYVVTEAANKVVYDAVQLHGGMGYMREMEVERLTRDVRITSIYEGATSVQVVGAIKHVMADVLGELFDRMEAAGYPADLSSSLKELTELRNLFRDCVTVVENEANAASREAAAKELTDMYAALYTGFLLLDEARTNDRKKIIARRYITGALAASQAGATRVHRSHFNDLEHTDSVCN